MNDAIRNDLKELEELILNSHELHAANLEKATENLAKHIDRVVESRVSEAVAGLEERLTSAIDMLVSSQD